MTQSPTRQAKARLRKAAQDRYPGNARARRERSQLLAYITPLVDGLSERFRLEFADVIDALDTAPLGRVYALASGIYLDLQQRKALGQ